MTEPWASVLELSLAGTGVLLLVGWIFGGAAERRHLAALAVCEDALNVVVSDLRSFPDAGPPPDPSAAFVCGEVVIANDYLKGFYAQLRGLIGGEVRAFRPLAERARREAILRMSQQAKAQGFDAVCNIRLAFSSLGFMSFAVIASGTAYSRRAAP